MAKSKKGLSTGAKIGIGAAVVVVAGAFIVPSVLGGGKTGPNSKVLHYALPTDLTTQDLSLMTDNYAFTIAGNTQEGLLSRDADGKPIAGLASSWEHNADGTQWTFTLRDGLKWSNGDKITANDFVYSWQRTVNPDTKSQYAYLFSGIQNADAINSGDNKDVTSLGIKAEGDNKIVVTLEHPMPQFENLMAFPTFFAEDSSFTKKQGDKVGTSADKQVYSGPYKLEGWNGSNASFKLVKNENYWDAKDVKTDEIDYKVVKDTASALAMYKRGELDSVGLNTPEDVSANKSSSDYKVIPEATTFYLNYNISKNKSLANENIRKGLDKAINRGEIANTLLSGSSTAATGLTPTGLSKTPSGQDFAAAVATQTSAAYTYNLDEAKQLIAQGEKELGVSSLEFTYTTDSDSAPAKAVAEYLQQSWEKVGVKVNLKYVPFKQRLQAATNGDFDIIAQLWGADYAEPTTFLDLFTTSSPNNAGKFSDSTYDSLLNKAHTTDALDDTARTNDEIQAEKILSDKAYISPIYFRATPSLVRSNVNGRVLYTSGVPVSLKQAVRK